MEAATARLANQTWSSRALNRLRTDRALVDRFRAGDETAFEVLHDRHESRVLAICVGVLGSTEDAKDASQEVFARVASALLEAPPAELRPWLARVTRNAAIDVARARRPRTEELPEDQPSTSPGPASTAEHHDQLDELMSGLRELPEPQRTALVMREPGGFDYAEIDRALDVDKTAVTGLIARARIGLRTHERALQVSCNSVQEQLAVEVDGRRRRA